MTIRESDEPVPMTKQLKLESANLVRQIDNLPTKQFFVCVNIAVIGWLALLVVVL